jgi:3-deoxy-D-manno-octulosonic-acid transferase
LIRILYAVLTYLLLPVYALYWFFRGTVNRAYWDRFSQRFGIGFPNIERGTFWIHAVSVGEVQASIPLVRALARRYPERPLLMTTVTPTGAARVRSVFGDSVHHCYIPFETPSAVSNFFDAVKPQLALIMETEIWPNLYRECGVRGIPLVLVSARISPKSVDSYRMLLPLFRETLSHGIVIAAQSEADAERFRSLGARAERTRVTGNIKFDIEIPADLIERGQEFRGHYLGRRPVWIAASTHAREEEQVLEAHRRVTEVARTSQRSVHAACSVFLGDTMGEVPLFYAASDVAFVGGTLVPVGGHNLLEPAALGLPVVTGMHLFNTQDIADMFVSIGALTRVSDASQLAVAIARLLRDEDTARRLGNLGREIVVKNRGALERLLRLVEPLITVAADGVRPATSSH